MGPLRRHSGATAVAPVVTVNVTDPEPETVPGTEHVVLVKAFDTVQVKLTVPAKFPSFVTTTVALPDAPIPRPRAQPAYEKQATSPAPRHVASTALCVRCIALDSCPVLDLETLQDAAPSLYSQRGRGRRTARNPCRDPRLLCVSAFARLRLHRLGKAVGI